MLLYRAMTQKLRVLSIADELHDAIRPVVKAPQGRRIDGEGLDPIRLQSTQMLPGRRT